MTDGGVYTAYMCFWDERAALCSALPLQACEGCNNAGLNYREQLGGRVLGPPGTEISFQNGSVGVYQHHQGHSYSGATHTCGLSRCLLNHSRIVFEKHFVLDSSVALFDV